MTPKRPALLPVELWEQLSAPLQIMLSAMVTHYEERIAELEAPGAGAKGAPQSEFTEFL